MKLVSGALVKDVRNFWACKIFFKFKQSLILRRVDSILYGRLLEFATNSRTWVSPKSQTEMRF
jgi:hypothetical protein